jgi:biotin synthase
LPKARVRLAAGRTRISHEGQALCFFAGANSIFFGDKLLTAKNPEVDVDLALLRELGLQVESTDGAEAAIPGRNESITCA